MNQYEKQGFDFDPELIDLFDAVLQNVVDGGELKEEFSKLKFIKKLEGTYNSRPGPLKQLIEKMGVMEREFTNTKLDLQRATSDMDHLIDIMKQIANSKTPVEMQESLGKLQGVKNRRRHYTWNE